MNILLGQLNNIGDCLLATTIARQIKTDFPKSKLTWAIGSCCRYVIDNNPYIDNIWEIPLVNTKQESVLNAWGFFKKEAALKKQNGEFDIVFYTQFSHGHLDNYMGITRASIFAGYTTDVTVPIQPILHLNANEVENVRKFAEANNLSSFSKVVLFECIGSSGQSFLTDSFIYEFCKLVLTNHPEICLVLSSNKKFEITGKNIIDASALSFRENAELTKYCTMFVGVSSGITWLSTSNWAKDLPKVILLNKDCPQASVVLDHAYYHINGAPVLEVNECIPSQLLNIVRQPSIDRTPLNNILFEQVCFYNPTIYHLNNKNFYRIRQLAATAPSFKIKYAILKLAIKFLAGKSKNFSKRLVKSLLRIK